jgi:hypothetical protein
VPCPRKTDGGLACGNLHETGTFESLHLCKLHAEVVLIEYSKARRGIAIRPLHQRRLFIATPEMVSRARKIVRDAKRMHEESKARSRTRIVHSETPYVPKSRLGLPRQNSGDDT